MEKQNLTQDEIDSLKELQKGFNELKNEIGDVEFKMIELSLYKDQLKNQFSLLKEKEHNLAQTLQSKYGDGSISLEEGTISSIN